MAFSQSVTHSKTLMNPSSGSADLVYGADYVSASSHAIALSGVVSGGVRFGTGTTTEDYSALLASGGIVIGGGAGNPPFTDTGLTYDSTNKALTVGGGTVTASTPVLNLSQTWNNAAVTFTGIVLNITKTNAASGSIYQDFQLGGVSKFNIYDSGGIPVVAFDGGVGSGYQYWDGGKMIFGGPIYCASYVDIAGNVWLNSAAGNLLKVGTAGGSFSDATVQAHYNSSDGTAGLTQASTVTLGKSITVKDGLIVAFA